MTLQTINTGLKLGSKFLGKETAYFLGMLLADEQINLKGVIYWQAPVRHNPKYATSLQLEEHLDFIKKIADPLGKRSDTELLESYILNNIPVIKFSSSKKGIVTLFEQEANPYSIDDFINDISNPLLSSSKEVQRAFLIGVFDGRGAYDKAGKFISLDCEHTETMDLVEKVLNQLGIGMNINSSAAGRKRTGTTASPRKPQIRIKREKFLEKIGYISPVKYENAIDSISAKYKKVNDIILPGVKIIK